jgi:hypothetical protein
MDLSKLFDDGKFEELLKNINYEEVLTNPNKALFGSLSWMLVEPSPKVVVDYIQENNLDISEKDYFFEFRLNDHTEPFNYEGRLITTFIREGRVDIINKLLEKGYIIQDTTLLNIAVKYSQKEMFHFLLRKGVPFEKDTCRGLTLFNDACRYGKISMVKTLLDLGYNLNMQELAFNNSLTSPLHSAYHSKNLKMVEFLLDRGANVDGFPYNSFTPLMVACRDGNLEMVQLLLDRGAKTETNVEEIFDTEESKLRYYQEIREFTCKNSNAVNFAVEGGHYDIAEELIFRGAEINYLRLFTIGDIALEKIYEIVKRYQDYKYKIGNIKGAK